MLMKFSEKAQKAIVVAESIAFDLGHQNVGSEHLLLSLLRMKEAKLASLLASQGVSEEAVEADLVRLFGRVETRPYYMEYTQVFKQILENAVLEAGEHHEKKVSLQTLSYALLIQKESVAHEILAGYDLDFDWLEDELKSQGISHEQLDAIDDLINLNRKLAKKPVHVIGREQEVGMLIEILCRKEKNNALIVGDAGVGKTALVEKLTQMMNHQEVPPQLADKVLYELDLASVVAGTKYRGEFEDKLKKIIRKVKEDGQVILFIDEIHNLVGAGGAEGAIDASNILKPYLARGEITCIGATTYEEYVRLFEKDRALNRRFQKIDLKEEGRENVCRILSGLKSQYESYHEITIPDELLPEIVDDSNRYLNERHQPDKALDVLDLACVHARMAHLSQLSKQDVLEVVEKLSGVNLHQDQPLSRLANKLHAVLLGQDAVIDGVIEHLTMMEAGLNVASQPRAVFLFVGPTGVGKTEMAKWIARTYYGSAQYLVRLDMSEYREASAVAKILGAPPGYVGYEDPSPLLSTIRRQPHSVVLLDEIEKAHRDVLHLFLQVFDEGELTDSRKQPVSFRDCIIIMTSNIGHHLQAPKRLGFQQATHPTQQILENYFSYEFMNRIDQIFYFQPLSREVCCQIIENNLTAYNEKLHREIQLSTSEMEEIIAASQVERYGARALQRSLKHYLFAHYLEKV